MSLDVAWLGANVVRVVEWMRDSGGAHRPIAIARGAGVSEDHVYKYLRRACRYGYLVNPARGIYQASELDGKVRVTTGRFDVMGPREEPDTPNMHH